MNFMKQSMLRYMVTQLIRPDSSNTDLENRLSTQCRAAWGDTPLTPGPSSLSPDSIMMAVITCSSPLWPSPGLLTCLLCWACQLQPGDWATVLSTTASPRQRERQQSRWIWLLPSLLQCRGWNEHTFKKHLRFHCAFMFWLGSKQNSLSVFILR